MCHAWIGGLTLTRWVRFFYLHRFTYHQQHPVQYQQLPFPTQFVGFSIMTLTGGYRLVKEEADSRGIPINLLTGLCMRTRFFQGLRKQCIALPQVVNENPYTFSKEGLKMSSTQILLFAEIPTSCMARAVRGLCPSFRIKVSTTTACLPSQPQ